MNEQYQNMMENNERQNHDEQHTPPKKGEEMRIWHNSNFGEPAFTVPVNDTEEARKYLKILADYDQYLGDKIISNAQGLEIFDNVNGEWTEWQDDDGFTITELMDMADDDDEE